MRFLFFYLDTISTTYIVSVIFPGLPSLGIRHCRYEFYLSVVLLVSMHFYCLITVHNCNNIIDCVHCSANPNWSFDPIYIIVYRPKFILNWSFDLLILQPYSVSVQQEYYKMDRISNLPSTIIESILCSIPIQEAARTSILSKGCFDTLRISRTVED